MWKNLTIIAVVVALLQWGLFIINEVLTGEFNMLVFIMAVGWTGWSVVAYSQLLNEN